MPGAASNSIRLHFGAITWAAALSLAIKITLALTTYGTNDVYTFERFSLWARYLGGEVYKTRWDSINVFNHPPFMVHVLTALNLAAEATGIPFQFWLRLPGILADVGTLYLTILILGNRISERPARRGLVMLAIAPAGILMSGFHGNTDGIMIFFVMLCVYLLDRGRSGSWAGVAYAMALSIKVVPVILAPAILLYLGTTRRRLRFAAEATVTFLLCSSPFIFQTPHQIAANILSYRGLYGMWGLARILWQLQRVPVIGDLNVLYAGLGTLATLVVVLMLSWIMNRQVQPPPLFSQVGMIFLVFLCLTSGFGIQYLAWLTPWVVELGVMPAAVLYLSNGAFMLLVYNLWSQGPPWFLADSNRAGVGWDEHLDYFQYVAWISVVVVAIVAWRRITGARTAGAAWRGRTAWLAAAAVLLSGVLIDRSSIPLEKRGADDLAEIRASYHLRLATILYERGRYADAVKVAKMAAAIDPAFEAKRDSARQR